MVISFHTTPIFGIWRQSLGNGGSDWPKRSFGVALHAWSSVTLHNPSRSLESQGEIPISGRVYGIHTDYRRGTRLPSVCLPEAPDQCQAVRTGIHARHITFSLCFVHHKGWPEDFVASGSETRRTGMPFLLPLSGLTLQVTPRACSRGLRRRGIGGTFGDTSIPV